VDQSAIDREVEQNLPWNAAVNLVDTAFIMLGLGMVARETVLPVLMDTLTGSPVWIGALNALAMLGMYLPQLFGAGWAERLERKKPFVALAGFGERLPYLLIAVILWQFGATAPLWCALAIVVLLGLSGASAGFGTPAWFDMITRVIPLRVRGRFAGGANGLGALMGLLGATLIGSILASVPGTGGYAMLFGIAFGCMLISWCGLVATREPPVRHRPAARGMLAYLRTLPAIVARDGNFRAFLVAMGIGRLGTMAGGFLLVAQADALQLDGAALGWLTGVAIGGQAVLNPLLGMLADRRGHRLVLLLGQLALAGSALFALLTPGWSGLVASFACLSAALAAEQASFLTIIPEFCEEPDRASYIGVTNTVMAPFTTIAPLAGGWLALGAGYPVLFASSAVLAIVGFAVLVRHVREPRTAGEASLAV